MDAPTPAAAVGTEAGQLSQHISALRLELASAREKGRRLQVAITSRERTLSRLQDQLIIHC